MSAEPDVPEIVEPDDESEPTPGYCERCGERTQGACVNGLCWECAKETRG